MSLSINEWKNIMRRLNASSYTHENIDKLISFCKRYCEIYDEFAKAPKLSTPLPHQVVASDMLLKSSTTTNALAHILPLLHEHPDHKMNVFLVLRSQLSDILAYLCLSTFIDRENLNDQTAFKNESELLNLDFLIATDTMYEEFKEIDRKFPPKDEIDLNDTPVNPLYEVFPHLIDPEKNKPFKKPTTIRSTTNEKFFKTPEEKMSFLKSEAQKIRRIRDYGDDDTKMIMAPASSAFKYFSQFQHYSRQSMFLFEHTHLNNDMTHIKLSLIQLSLISDLQYRQLTSKENQYSAKMKELLKLLDGISTTRS